MILLAIDGNSIINRAYYGIKLLSTKDGRYFTNAIQGFMNILLKLKADCKPDAVAIAFDVKQPTFRHQMYSEYKAGRHEMPDELKQQFPVLKELLAALGYKLVECPGFEADDILGTLSANCREGDKCFIATGDRDSLQLVGDNVRVMLAKTSMGASQTLCYTPEKIKEEYLVSSPDLLIDVKALQGDSSDNIPGVAGVGPKTATELVSQYGTIDEIYEKIEELPLKKGVHDKLVAGKESAYLSRTLGTIKRDIPIETEYSVYIPEKPDAYAVTALLTKLEMFKMLDRLKLEPVKIPVSAADTEKKFSTETYIQSRPMLLLTELKRNGRAYFTFDGGIFRFATEKGIAVVEPGNDEYVQFIGEFLNDESLPKYTFNFKKLCRFFASYGEDIRLLGIKGDAMLSAYVLNPSAGDYSLVRLANEFAGAGLSEENENAAITATAYLPAVFEKTDAAIDLNGQRDLLEKIELPLSRVLASMEETGFAVDRQGLETFGERLSGEIDKLTDKIFEQTGYTFNLNSPKQLGEALFEKMELPCGKKTKTGYSTNAAVLEELAGRYPVVSDILEYRALTKLKSTYCEGLLKAIAEDGRIHASFNQVDTRTGRISCAEPNLQNIPVRTPLGKEMRRFFVAKEGSRLVDADYSQIELRVLASMANDKNMISAFSAGDDIHAITASQVFGLPLLMVTPEIRSKAKAVNFGIVYGIGAFSLAKQVNATVKEAEKYIRDYLDNFAGIKKFMEDTVNFARANGYVETLFKRRRYIPEITASNYNVRSAAERMAMNMPVQGTAADIIKLAMIRVYNALREGSYKAKLVLQIHDELIIEAPEEEISLVSSLLKTEMENAVKLSVSMLSDVGNGKTWLEAK